MLALPAGPGKVSAGAIRFMCFYMLGLVAAGAIGAAFALASH